MAYENSDNGARMAGFTQEYIAESGRCVDLHISVKPGTNFDDAFKAFCHDTQEYITVNGWLFTFDPVAE